MRFNSISRLAACLFVLAVLVGGCSEGNIVSPPVSPESLGIDLTDADRCDPIVPQRCLLPLPNDYYTVADDSTPTGLRVHLDSASLPANVKGSHLDATEWNRNDGFSPGSAVLVFFPGVDLTTSGTPRIDDIATSLGDDSPIFAIDADSRERRPLWAELDAYARSDAERTLILRPAVNWREGHRYIVGFRGLKDAAGTVLEPSPAFRAYRDDQRTTDAQFEARREHFGVIFSALAAAGIDAADVQLAFDFTVASREGLSERMLRIRDDGFARLGGAVPPFTVDTVEDNLEPRVARRITGTFQIPSYLTGDGSPGSSFAYGSDGLPAFQGRFLTAPFQCVVPPTAFGDGQTTVPARVSLYGHGLLGSYGELGSDLVRDMAVRHNIVYCATNWIGLSEEDVGNAIAILSDLSRFPTLADRSQQGFLNFLYLGRLLSHPQGLSTHPAFQSSGAPLFDRTQLFFDGNSQGAIYGGALMAFAQDFTRGVLGEAGMNYSFLLQRSVDFDDYKLVFDPAYPDPYDQLVGIQLIQMLWDRSEADGYAQHLTDDPLPGTPAHQILLLGAIGDHQVSEYALQVEARTIGVQWHVPVAASDRTTNNDKAFGVDPVPSYPWDGSAYFLFDTGSPLSPLGNVPAREGHDPHDDTPNIPAAQDLKSSFMRPNGTVIDVCDAAPCVGEPHD